MYKYQERERTKQENDLDGRTFILVCLVILGIAVYLGWVVIGGWYWVG